MLGVIPPALVTQQNQPYGPVGGWVIFKIFLTLGTAKQMLSMPWFSRQTQSSSLTSHWITVRDGTN